MASSASLMSAIPHIDCSGRVVHGNRRPSRATSSTLLQSRSPSAALVCRTSARSDWRRRSPSSKHRFLQEVGTEKLQTQRRIASKLFGCTCNETLKTRASFPEQLDCVSFFRNRHRRGRRFKRDYLRAFQDRSSFPLQRQMFENNSVKPAHVTYANVGPDEPHVASTAWSDTVLEKPGIGLWDPETEGTEWERFLSSPLPPHPKLYRGQLKNGLRFIILPNKVPGNRFEAHMEVHAGSIDEEDDEQGIAHMIEHVAFLGSKKREKLLGTGARSNAYTDFHHTVFHIHSPTRTKVCPNRRKNESQIKRRSSRAPHSISHICDWISWS